MRKRVKTKCTLRGETLPYTIYKHHERAHNYRGMSHDYLFIKTASKKAMSDRLYQIRLYNMRRYAETQK